MGSGDVCVGGGVGGGIGPLGEEAHGGWGVGRGIQSQVTFSRESSCEHSAPGRRVTAQSSASYVPGPGFSRTVFALHRSEITKPIKKPRRGAERGLTIASLRLGNQNYSSRDYLSTSNKENTGNYHRIPLFSFFPFCRTDVVTHIATFNLSQKHA